MKMKSVTVRQEEFYSWQQKILTKKTPKKNMKKPKKDMKKSNMKLKRTEVDYREELMCAIEVIRREKKKNKKLQAKNRQEKRHSRTRTNDHKIEGSNRRR
jgi:hypothetical protein